MGKKKSKRKIFPTEFIMEDIQNYNADATITTINSFLYGEDGSCLSEEQAKEITVLFEEHTNIMKLICCAHEDYGYNSF